jgi:hypothetical protein
MRCYQMATKRRRGRGRPTTYNRKKVDDIRKSVELGLSVRSACFANGVQPQTFLAWQRARPELEGMMAESKARFAQAHLMNIKQHARDQWTASAWLLERCQSEDFAKPEIKLQMLQVNGDAEKAANTAIWLQQPTGLPGQQFPELEDMTCSGLDDDMPEPPQLPAPYAPGIAPDVSHLSPRLREHEMRKQSATTPREVETEVMPEPAMLEYQRKLNAHIADLGPVGEQLRQMQDGRMVGQAARPSPLPNPHYQGADGGVQPIDWKD